MKSSQVVDGRRHHPAGARVAEQPLDGRRSVCREKAAPPHAFIARSVTSTRRLERRLARREHEQRRLGRAAPRSRRARARAARATPRCARSSAPAARAGCGRSRSAVPVCSKPVADRCAAVAATAARHSPCAMAAVPMANQGRIDLQHRLGARALLASSRSPRATVRFSMLTGAESLPRRPSPSKPALRADRRALRCARDRASTPAATARPASARSTTYESA